MAVAEVSVSRIVGGWARTKSANNFQGGVHRQLGQNYFRAILLKGISLYRGYDLPIVSL